MAVVDVEDLDGLEVLAFEDLVDVIEVVESEDPVVAMEVLASKDRLVECFVPQPVTPAVEVVETIPIRDVDDQIVVFVFVDVVEPNQGD